MLGSIGCVKTRSNFAVMHSFEDPINPSSYHRLSALQNCLLWVPLDLPKCMLSTTNSSITHNASGTLVKTEFSSHQFGFVTYLWPALQDCILLRMKWADTGLVYKSSNLQVTGKEAESSNFHNFMRARYLYPHLMLWYFCNLLPCPGFKLHYASFYILY